MNRTHNSALARSVSRPALVFSLLILISSLIQPAKATGYHKVFLPAVMKNHAWGLGGVTGKVVDTSTGDPLPDTRICFAELFCTITDSLGDYSLDGIPTGYQDIEASAVSYNPLVQGVYVFVHQIAKLNFALTPQLAGSDVEIQVVLTWSVSETWPPDNFPNDLDAHLWLNVPGPPTHIGYYDGNYHPGDCATFPSACLEVDRQRGSGPETVSFGRTKENAIYTYGVLNYNQFQPGVPPITRTAAQVRVYTEAGLANVFNVPDNGEGNFWYLFQMDGETREITPVNCITFYTGDIPKCP